MVHIDTKAKSLDSIPRLHWSPQKHRFQFNYPIASEPGAKGFILFHEFETPDSYGAWMLPANEKEHLEKMDQVNHWIQDAERAESLHDTVKMLEKKRMHNDEYHESENKENNIPKSPKKYTKKKQLHAKKIVNMKRPKPPRMGYVHQPR